MSTLPRSTLTNDQMAQKNSKIWVYILKVNGILNLVQFANDRERVSGVKYSLLLQKNEEKQ